MRAVRVLRNAARITRRFDGGPDLHDFIRGNDHSTMPLQHQDSTTGTKNGVFVETYGCQMNTSDTEVVYAILQQHGYQLADSPQEAQIILLNTCAIRDNAEAKIWQRLRQLRSPKNGYRVQTVGVLGCMAERLKHKLLEEEALVDVVVGPDAYRDLPRLLQSSQDPNVSESAINVMLSADETYADIAPVRRDANGVSAYVSIMRGCNNMCAFCIVPFTRGRERSRNVASIVHEVQQLESAGYRELTLLGQNVNSYCDHTTPTRYPDLCPSLAADFNTVYKLREDRAVRFAELLERVSDAAPSMRIRFTSPHPKDFPDDVLRVVGERPNVCNQIHIPAQSGSSRVLEQMRRGYTREAYLALTDRIRERIPGVALSTDMIAGFCGETEKDHEDTISLMKLVKYEAAFMFAYSLREKTLAHRRYQDDVPPEVKGARLRDIIDTFHSVSEKQNQKEVGRIHSVLIDKLSKKSDQDLAGRTDTNKRVVFPRYPQLGDSDGNRLPSIGDLVRVRITAASSASLKGEIVDFIA